MIKTKHRVFVSGDVSVIEVYNKTKSLFFYVLVDTEDLETIKNTVDSLSIQMNKNTNYCLYRSNQKTSPLHRLIMKTPSHLVVDHIFHNGLDNRKKNLRNCTHRENSQNRIEGLRNSLYWVNKRRK